MRGRFAPYIVGLGLLGLAAIALFFCLYAVLLDESAAGFAVMCVLSGVAGGELVWLGTSNAGPTRREAIIGVLLLWLVLPIVGMIPYSASGAFTPLNALFESTSGFTATGATALRNFDEVSRSLFMYRSLSQWLGGIGIIVLFVAVFPQLAIAGRQLFFAEAPGPTEEKLTPRLRNTASAVLLVYVGLSVLCALIYWLVGMTPYDAVAHTFTTLAASGFSPNPLSYQEFNPTIQWVAIVFMAVGGTNFALQYQLLSGRPQDLLRDAEFRAYLGILAVAALLLTFALRSNYGLVDAVRHALFQAISIMTTTGYASVDFIEWPQQAQMVLLVAHVCWRQRGQRGGRRSR